MIFLSMHGEESTFNTAMNAGAQGYILKENAVHDVLLGLRAVAEGGMYLSPGIAKFLVRRNQRASALRQEKKGLASLTPTQRNIVRLVAENKTNKEIGDALCISPRTVEKHRAHSAVSTPKGLRHVPVPGRNPVGVVCHLPAFPRVARSSQPWALSRNPFGIQCWNFRKALSLGSLQAL